MCDLVNWASVPQASTLNIADVNEIMVVVNGEPKRMTKADFVACLFGQLPKHTSQINAQAAGDAVYIADAAHLSATEGTLIITP